MKELQRQITAALQRPADAARWREATGGTPQECPPIYSFDNCSVHTKDAHLRDLGLMLEDGTATDAWLPLPAYSPDLHRTIERTFGRVSETVQQWLRRLRHKPDMEEASRQVLKIFRDTQTSDTISKCMWGKHSLLDLYRHVSDLGGAKAVRPHR